MPVLAVMAATTIWISAPPDPVCGFAEGVTSSLTELVPDATVRIGDVAGADELVVRIEPHGDEVGVTVADGQHSILLTRTLHRTGACRELVETVALILERYLSDLGWKPATPIVPPSSQESPAAITSGAITSAPRDGPPLHVELAARGQLALSPAQLGGALEVILARNALQLGLEIGGFAPHSQAAMGIDGVMIGNVEMSSVYALAGAGLGFGHARVMLRAGGERLAASASGNGVFQMADHSAWEVVARGDLGYRFAITSALLFEVSAGLELHPHPVAITVEGGSGTPTDPRLRAVMAGCAIWRFR